MSIYLVEVSPALSEIQAKLLTKDNHKLLDKHTVVSQKQLAIDLEFMYKGIVFSNLNRNVGSLIILLHTKNVVHGLNMC